MANNKHRGNTNSAFGNGSRIDVKNNNIDGALKALKKRLMNDGFYKDIKRIESYEKPSEKRRREKAEARRRHLKKMSQQSDRI